jgi:hypothetical protein
MSRADSGAQSVRCTSSRASAESRIDDLPVRDGASFARRSSKLGKTAPSSKLSSGRADESCAADSSGDWKRRIRCRHFQLSAACRSRSGRTFNPKVAGSSQHGPWGAALRPTTAVRMEIEPAAVSAIRRDVVRIRRRIELAPRDATEPFGFASARSQRFRHGSEVLVRVALGARLVIDTAQMLELVRERGQRFGSRETWNASYSGHVQPAARRRRKVNPTPVDRRVGRYFVAVT